MGKQFGWVVLGTLALGGVAYADEDAAPPAPATGDATPDSTWASRAQLGYSKTSGNTDTSAANAVFRIAHVVDDWKFLFGADGLYGSTKGETTAQAWDANLQANYNITEHLYWFTGLTYVDNKFSGFAYQEMLSTGVGYQFIKTDDNKLSGQIGPGVRRLRPELLTEDSVGGITGVTELDAQTTAVVDAALNFEHAFNSSTKLLSGVAVEAGKGNTLTTANIGIQVKMSTALALAAAVQYVRNSSPPMGVSPSATLTTLNLVYELKNPKLAPQ